MTRQPGVKISSPWLTLKLSFSIFVTVFINTFLLSKDNWNIVLLYSIEDFSCRDSRQSEIGLISRELITWSESVWRQKDRKTKRWKDIKTNREKTWKDRKTNREKIWKDRKTNRLTSWTYFTRPNHVIWFLFWSILLHKYNHHQYLYQCPFQNMLTTFTKYVVLIFTKVFIY